MYEEPFSDNVEASDDEDLFHGLEDDDSDDDDEPKDLFLGERS